VKCAECRFWNLDFPDFWFLNNDRVAEGKRLGRCQVEDPSRWKNTREIDWCGRFETKERPRPTRADFRIPALQKGANSGGS
jgi:hypothetical protein